MEVFLKRVLTGLILIPIVVYIVLYTSVFWIFAAASVLNLLALSEYNHLSIVRIRDRWSDALGLLTGASVPPILFFCGKGAFIPALLAFVFLFFLLGMARGRDLRDASADTAFKTLGLAYIALPLSHIVFLRELERGEWWMMFLLVIIWANDTFAYFVGKTLGKHKLTPAISPKKTVEGAVGGLIGGIIGAWLLNRYFSLGLGVFEVVALSLVLGVVGIIGDLAESLLKRAVGIKDSGTLIPGHGGVLDRIDSLIFAFPALYYFLLWRINYPA